MIDLVRVGRSGSSRGTVHIQGWHRAGHCRPVLPPTGMLPTLVNQGSPLGPGRESVDVVVVAPEHSLTWDTLH